MGGEIGVKLSLVVQVSLFFTPLGGDFVQWRAGNVDVTLFQQLALVSVQFSEEMYQKRIISQYQN